MNLKLFDFNSKNIFGALFTTICLFIVEVLFIAAFENVFSDIGAYCVTYAIFILLIYIKERKYINDNIKNLKNDVKGKLKNIIIVTAILLIIEVILNIILTKLLGHGPNNNEIIVNSLNNYNIFTFIIYAFILCPILEGLIFTYPYKNVNNKLLAYITMSIVFALMHLTSSNNLLDLLFILPYSSMVFAFNYGFYKTNNCLVSIIVHSINNILALVLLFII